MSRRNEPYVSFNGSKVNVSSLSIAQLDLMVQLTELELAAWEGALSALTAAVPASRLVVVTRRRIAKIKRLSDECRRQIG